MADPAPLDVVGYRICARDGCEQLVLDLVACRTGGFCADCVHLGLAERAKTLLVSIPGGRTDVPVARKPKTGRNRRQHLRRKDDPRRKAAKLVRQAAERAAMRRLRGLCPELYALVLADERHQRGLTPLTVEQAAVPGSGITGWETMDAVAFYHALARQENIADGPQHPSS